MAWLTGILVPASSSLQQPLPSTSITPPSDAMHYQRKSSTRPRRRRPATVMPSSPAAPSVPVHSSVAPSGEAVVSWAAAAAVAMVVVVQAMSAVRTRAASTAAAAVVLRRLTSDSLSSLW
ncbi:hypothetical protein E2562_006259 [Oryza meyeriana var. granulata]|uniref:Uncharacterized protein n=1 Tax=Oryza meyeriana var. granulata TaxID=110450 RepID=A0A6G1EEY2_9ORYZ|nr:hypothetical protein E2562_006259 [Oryza meyeriana var. granulata]